MTHVAPFLSMAQRGLIGAGVGSCFLLGLLADQPLLLPLVVLSGAACAAPLALWAKAAEPRRPAESG